MSSNFMNEPQDKLSDVAKRLRELADQVDRDELPAIIVGIIDEDGSVGVGACFDAICSSCIRDFVTTVANAILSQIAEDPGRPTEHCQLN